MITLTVSACLRVKTQGQHLLHPTTPGALQYKSATKHIKPFTCIRITPSVYFDACGNWKLPVIVLEKGDGVVVLLGHGRPGLLPLKRHRVLVERCLSYPAIFDRTLADLNYLGGSSQQQMNRWFSLMNTHSGGIATKEESGSTTTLFSLVIFTWGLAAT